MKRRPVRLGQSGQSGPICPRCGYDQTGVIATWSSSCPVQGRCTECGHEFAWADVIDPRRRDLPWYAEHAGRTVEVIHRTLPTLWIIALPHRFWRRVGLEARTAPWRLVMWLFIVAIGARIVTSLPIAMLDYWDHISTLPPAIGALDRAETLIHHAIASAATAVLMPFAYVLISSGSYSVKLLEPVAALGLAVIPASFAVGVSMMWVILLALFPVTRRHAKLRRGHVIRAALLAMVAAIIVHEAVRAVTLIIEYTRWGPRGTEELLFGVLGISIAWTLLFWAAAIRVAWRIQSWTMLLLGSLAGILTTPALIAALLFLLA